jgi:glycosyltransferase involved in cell wall biosynthesis
MSKVLFLCDIELCNPMRGTPIHVARLLTELRGEHDLVICAASVPDGLKDVFVQYPRGRGLEKLWALLHITDEHTPDIIFTIGQTGLMGPVLLKFLRNVPIVVELQGVEYIEKYAMGHINWFECHIWKYKSILLLPLFDAVIAFTRRTAGLYPFLRNVKIIFPGIDLETVPYDREPKPMPPLIAGYAGNTDAYQGLVHLIEAIALVRERGLDARLHLVLTGDDAKVRARIEALNLSSVTSIVRNVSHTEAQQEMCKTSTIVIPRTNALESVYGFPSKLPEALAMGIPVILTNVGPVPELMPELGEHTLVIPAEDISSHLADALTRVAHMSVAERKQWGDNARTYAKRFSWERATAVASEAFKSVAW